jgi:hypothetical protein
MVKVANPPAESGETTTERQPLWPGGFDLGVIGLTGDFGTGKTIFGLSICPGSDTLIYDAEDGAETYKTLGFHRVSMSTEMLKKHPKGYKPIDLFNWWLAHVRSIKPGQYRVIVLDPVSEIENGLVEFVRQNPAQFGYTAGQFAAAAPLMQGAAKDFWKSILVDIRARCETFVFTSHLRKVFKGGTPTGKKEPKGKETLFQLASLYLRLERVADSKGVVPEVPSAIPLKHRLAKHEIVDGDLQWISLLPPRIPTATPASIRKYILSPPDYSKLKPGERVVEEKMSEEELTAMRLAAAEAEREAEALKAERLDRADRMAKQRTEVKAAAPAATPTPSQQPSINEVKKSVEPKNTESPSAAVVPHVGAVTDIQLGRIRDYKAACKITDPEVWAQILAKRNVKSARDLTEVQAEELIESLSKKAMKVAHQQAHDELAVAKN